MGKEFGGCVTAHENCTPKWALITGLCAWRLPYIKLSREKIFIDQWEGREFGTACLKFRGDNFEFTGGYKIV